MGRFHTDPQRIPALRATRRPSCHLLWTEVSRRYDYMVGGGISCAYVADSAGVALALNMCGISYARVLA